MSYINNCKLLKMGWFGSSFTFEGKGLLSYSSIERKKIEKGKQLDIVTIDPGITSIESSFFCGFNMTQIKLSPNLLTIGASCFSSCQNLVEIVIPSGVIKIESNTFKGCSSLKKIVLPNGITKLGSRCFQDCCSLEEIVLPPTLEIIEEYAFSGCTSLKSFAIPRSVHSIQKEAFSGLCFESLVIPEGVTHIPEGLCRGCVFLKSVSLPSTLIEIDGTSFLGCLELEYLSIPNSVQKIVSRGNASLPKAIQITSESFLATRVWSLEPSSHFIVDVSTKEQYYYLLDELYKIRLNFSKKKEQIMFIKRIIVNYNYFYISYEDIVTWGINNFPRFDQIKHSLDLKRNNDMSCEPHHISKNLLNAVKYSNFGL